jgi:hypothetical protein
MVEPYETDDDDSSSSNERRGSKEVYNIYINDSALNESGYTRFALHLLNGGGNAKGSGNAKGTVILHNDDPGRIIYCDFYRSDYPKTIQSFKDKLLASSKDTTDEFIDRKIFMTCTKNYRN